MTDTAPMNRIKDKPFSQRNKVEECILLVWEEIGLEHIAYKAAVELEALTAPQQQADGLVAALKAIDLIAENGMGEWAGILPPYLPANIETLYDIRQEISNALSEMENK